MTATDLLADLQQRGVELKADGERLLYRPKDALTSELHQALARHKAELLALLSQPPPPSPSTWKRITFILPGDTRLPLIHDQWRRLESGEIEATFTREQLALCLGIIGRVTSNE
jgi:hypothetical protein